MSVAEVQARIATLRAAFAPAAEAPPATPPDTAAVDGAGAPFGALLQQALHSGTGSSSSPGSTLAGMLSGLGAQRAAISGEGAAGPMLTLQALAGLAGTLPKGLEVAGVAGPSLSLTMDELPPPPQGAEWIDRLPDAARPFAGAIDEAAREAGIDPRLVAAVAWTESGFRPDARSGAGAIGLMQLMPGTAAGLEVDPHDPRDNLRGGARYLAAQLERFGRLDLALAAYNAGPGAVTRHGGIPPYAETRGYVTRVSARFDELTTAPVQEAR